MKLIFLDRDGVINEDPQKDLYVMKPEQLHFISGAIEAVKKLFDNGYNIHIISNQAGVSRGLFTAAALDKVTDSMVREIERAGGRLASVNYCPHKDEDGCDCRKPKTGLFRKAIGNKKIDFSKAYFIGDGKVDIEAGKAIGCKTILVLSGKSSRADVAGWSAKPDFIKNGLTEAVDFVLK